MGKSILPPLHPDLEHMRNLHPNRMQSVSQSKEQAKARYHQVHSSQHQYQHDQNEQTPQLYHPRQTPFAPVARLPLPLAEELLTTRIGARFSAPAAGRSSAEEATVVRRAAPLTMGAERGLRTLGFHSPSWLFLTMRRAALAEMLFSFGGLEEDVLLGLRWRWFRFAGAGFVVEERRLMAVRMRLASEGSTDQPSSSAAELLPLSFADSDACSTLLRAEGRTVFVPISRRGEVSESEP